MKQRINLYNPYKPREKFDPLSLKGSLTVLTALVAVVLSIGVALHLLAGQSADEFAQLKAEKRSLDSAVAKEKSRFQSLQVKPEILAEQERLKSEIQARQQLQLLLHRLQPEQSSTFSEYLYAFSEASQRESWLEQFILNMNEQQLQLKGAATHGPAVPAMLEALGRTEMFQGMSVAGLKVEALEKGVRFQATAELRRYE